MPTTTRSRRVKAVAALCAFGLLAVACGDDDDTDAAADDTSTTVAEAEGADGEFAEYCTAVAEMEESEGFDAAQFERIRDAAPDEISEEIDYVVDAFIEAEGDMGKVFTDPRVEEELGPIEDFEAEHCPGEEDEEFVVAAEYEEWCGFMEELDSQDGPPTNEQMERVKEIAPDTVREDAVFVADKFIAANGDVGQVFTDPAVEEAFGRMEDHDAEHCGIETEENEEEDDEQATEPLDGAAVVDVTAVDFAFEGIPETLPAGADVSFSFTNGGEVAHEMFMARLGEGVVLDDLLAMEEEPSEEQAQDIGGVFGAPGDETVYLNAEDLEPGTYAVVCFIPGPDGKAHHELGMKTTFTVS